MRSFVVLTAVFLTASASIQVNHALHRLVARELDSSCTGDKQQLVQEMMKDCFEMATKASAAAKEGKTEFLQKIFKSSSPEQVSANFDRIAEACANNSQVQIRCSPSQAECAAGLAGGNSLSNENIAATAGPRMGVKLCPLTHERKKVEKACGGNNGGGLLVHEMSHDVLTTGDSSSKQYGYEVTLNEQQPLKHADAYNYFSQATGLNCSEEDMKKGGTSEGVGDIGSFDAGFGKQRPENVLPVFNQSDSSTGSPDARERNSTTNAGPTSSLGSSGPEATTGTQIPGSDRSNTTDAGREPGAGGETGEGRQPGQNKEDPLSRPDSSNGPDSNPLDQDDSVNGNGRSRPQNRPGSNSGEPSSERELPSGGNRGEDDNSNGPLRPNQPGGGPRTPTAGGQDSGNFRTPGEAAPGSREPGPSNEDEENLIDSSGPRRPKSNVAGPKRGDRTNPTSQQRGQPIDSSTPSRSTQPGTDANRGSPVNSAGDEQNNLIPSTRSKSSSNAAGSNRGNVLEPKNRDQGKLIDSATVRKTVSSPTGQNRGNRVNPVGADQSNLIPSTRSQSGPSAAGPSRGNSFRPASQGPGNPIGSLNAVTPNTGSEKKGNPTKPATQGPGSLIGSLNAVTPGAGSETKSDPINPTTQGPGSLIGSLNAVSPSTSGEEQGNPFESPRQERNNLVDPSTPSNSASTNAGQEAGHAFGSGSFGVPTLPDGGSMGLRNIPEKFQQPQGQPETLAGGLSDMEGSMASPATEQMTGGESMMKR
ncbi:hypothetical protein CP533_1807 [Ophiocordyceps camponoti-saundersi (nom. inval.)]|nr:hypothetical protein CP533_1807 [Ophiocordyceps camponoti-saundersi (nom. inval.)]